MNKILLGTTCTLIAGTIGFFVFTHNSNNVSQNVQTSAPTRSIASKPVKIDPIKFAEFQKTPEFKNKVKELVAQNKTISNDDFEKIYRDYGFDQFNWKKNDKGEVTGFEAKMKPEVNVQNKVVFNEEKWATAEDSIVSGLNKNTDYQITSEDQAMVDSWKKSKN